VLLSGRPRRTCAWNCARPAASNAGPKVAPLSGTTPRSGTFYFGGGASLTWYNPARKAGGRGRAWAATYSRPAAIGALDLSEGLAPSSKAREALNLCLSLRRRHWSRFAKRVAKRPSTAWAPLSVAHRPFFESRPFSQLRMDVPLHSARAHSGIRVKNERAGILLWELTYEAAISDWIRITRAWMRRALSWG
jgi:hypothetical protein